MMKRLNLQIGDLVAINHYIHGEQIGELISINDAQDMCFYIHKLEEEYECTQNEIYPLLLNSERLLTNNFKRCISYGMTAYTLPSGIGVKHCGVPNVFHLVYCGYDTKIPIMYIHELQQYLRLVGNDIKIEL